MLEGVGLFGIFLFYFSLLYFAKSASGSALYIIGFMWRGAFALWVVQGPLLLFIYASPFKYGSKKEKKNAFLKLDMEEILFICLFFFFLFAGTCHNLT